MLRTVMSILLITLLTGSFAQSRKYEIRPKLTVNTSVATLFSWRVFDAPFVDMGAEYRINKKLSVNSALGRFYRSPWNINRNEVKGYFMRSSLRWYPFRPNVFHPYFGILLKHDSKRIDRVFDFTANYWPYNKKARERRNSNFVMLEMGAMNLLRGRRFTLDVNLAVGVEFFKRDFPGLTEEEAEAAFNGNVDGIPEIDSPMINADYLIDFKLGYSIF